MILESAIEKRISKHFKKNPDIIWLKITPLGVRGIPDRIAILPKGKVIWCELKRPKGRPSKIQEWFHRRLTKLGHCVKLFSTSDACIQFIEEAMEDD